MQNLPRQPLSDAERRYCEGVVSGLSQTDAYQAAFPDCSRRTATQRAHRLARAASIQDEIARRRGEADFAPASAVLTLLEKRRFLARVVRAHLHTLAAQDDGDLIADLNVYRRRNGDTVKRIRLSDKLAAIELDNRLAGAGSESKTSDAVAEMIRSVVQ